MIKIKNLYKTFTTKDSEVSAVQDVSLNIKKGSVYGIVGFSGAGKSTLVRCINRLEEPTSGHIYIGEDEITGASDTKLRNMRKNIGMIFQHFHLLNMKTVGENIAFPLKINNATDKEERIDELLKLVGLTDKKNSYPSQLSGGEKQRVGIARALANNPSVLLCDEATSALDPKTTKSILKLLKDINEKLGVTIVIITHEMDVIKEICDKVAVMEKGLVVDKGDVVDVFSSSNNPVTNQFIKSLSYDLPDSISLDNGHLIVRISYKSGPVGQPLLSQAVRKFNIDTNILSGGIDNLGTNIIGNLIVELIGDTKNIKEAMSFLEENKVRVERMNPNE